MSRRPLTLLLLLALAAGCAKGAKPVAAPEPAAVEVLTQKSEEGPVKATVTLGPKKPRLGDPLTLTLTVEAQPGVRVEMPPFGDALGRFSIASFTPRSETAPDGSSRHSQRYVLEAPMSGRQRIPSLRIEFVDSRPGAARADGGAEPIRELLTDEIAIDITSVLPEGDKAELRGLRGPLEEGMGRARALGLAIVPVLLALAAGIFWSVRRMRRAARQRVRITAYDVAVQRMAKLKGRGWPDEQTVDAFYVELSDIVRRYIEDRYGVRAPELTTEEFLRAARSELRLVPAQREMLEAFLSTCDRVKFAGYRPGEFESRQAFGEAASFLDDTRPDPPSRPEGRA
jgi:hypothetical protein